MDKKTKNKLYDKQGIHVINSIFTVENSILKVLLIKEKDEFLLIGGKLYNTEEASYGALRELEEKTTLRDVNLYFHNIFSKPYRAINDRMIAFGYIGMVNVDDITPILHDNNKFQLFPINDLPKMAYDHLEIINDAKEYLKHLVVNSNILKSVMPEFWTMVELRGIFEAVYDKELDRRNFRKKILAFKTVEDSKKKSKGIKGRPAKLYKFKKQIKKEELF